jgi:hypothetical protein
MILHGVASQGEFVALATGMPTTITMTTITRSAGLSSALAELGGYSISSPAWVHIVIDTTFARTCGMARCNKLLFLFVNTQPPQPGQRGQALLIEEVANGGVMSATGIDRRSTATTRRST